MSVEVKSVDRRTHVVVGWCMANVVQDINHRVDARYRGARVVCLGGVAAGWMPTVTDLRRRDVDSFLVLHHGPGTGSVPSGDDVLLIDAEVTIPTGEIIEEFRVWSALASDPPARLAAALDAFDPDHTALLLCTPPTPLETFGDRPIHGGRRRAWVDFEDKTRVDALLDRADVAHPRSEVVDVAGAPWAARRLDEGAGTVWSGDSREGFNGGATRVRWVATERDIDDAVAFFGAEHDTVRVAPFVEGVPCSIHGLVGPEQIAVFRPCEMLIMRRPDRRFVYCGVATAWDPDADDRETMREAARRVGSTLRTEVDFRGTFTVDGIMSTDGFVVTEVNPRFGGGMARIAGGVESLPLVELHRELIADPTYDPDAETLEAVVLTDADRHRSFSAWTFLHTPLAETTTFRFLLDGQTTVAASPGEPAIEATVGPAVTGSMLRVDLAEVAPEPGPMFAPLAADALRAAAGIGGVDLGAIEPARSVR